MLFNWSKSREKQTRKKAFHHLGWLVIAVVPHASSWWELALTPLFWICHRNTSDIKQIRELIRLMTDWPSDIITYLFPYSLPMSGKLCFLTSLRCGSVAAWFEGIGGKGIYEKVKSKIILLWQTEETAIWMRIEVTSFYTNLQIFRPGWLSLLPCDTSFHVSEASLHLVMKRTQVFRC